MLRLEQEPAYSVRFVIDTGDELVEVAGEDGKPIEDEDDDADLAVEARIEVLFGELASRGIRIEQYARRWSKLALDACSVGVFTALRQDETTWIAESHVWQ